MKRLIAGSTLFIALAAGADCPDNLAYPQAPDFSSLQGKSATFEQIATARRITRDYMRDVELYLACVPRSYSVQYDQLVWSVAEARRVYNLQLREFKARQLEVLAIN